MKFDLIEYSKMLQDRNISIIYSGPVWAESINGFSETLQNRLDLSGMPFNAAQSVFSVFVEQLNNMIMYSEEKEYLSTTDGNCYEVSKGIFTFGASDGIYFVQSGNLIKTSSIPNLEKRLNYLNSLDKKELRQYYKEQIKSENENPESKGAGVGLIEIARRASSKIEFDFTPQDDDMSYFSMYVTIAAEKSEN